MINEILRDSIDQMERRIMSENDDKTLIHGPELVSVVDVAGTRDLNSLQDMVAYVHAKKGNIHAPFGGGECTFFTIHDEEYEEPAIYPYRKHFFASSTVVLTNESIEEAISSPNGYFEFDRFLSYAPGGWNKAEGFTCFIEPPKSIGVKVIQLYFERSFISNLNLPATGIIINPTSEFGTISEELEKFCNDKIRTGDWTPETLDNYKSIFNTFVEIVGDKSVDSITRGDIQDYLNVIDTLPPNRKKIKPFRDMDAKSASELNAKMGGKSLSKNTKNNYIQRLAEPFEEFVISRIFNYNFFKNARSYKITAEEKLDAREPWSSEEIKKMIESDEAIQLLAKSTTQVSKPWALLICLFTGVRIGEILSLPLDGVGWDDDVPYFDFIVREGHNRLKRPASKRRIPIHPTLIELGFLKYLERAQEVQKNVTTPMLFCDVKKTVKHGWGRATENWYNNSFYKKLGIKTEKKVTHSFRHNISDIFRRAEGVNQLKVSAYIGHSDNYKKPEWQKGYGSPYSPKELLEITKYIQYDVDFSMLKKNCLEKLRPRLDRKDRI